MTLVVSRTSRDALYRALATELGSIGDIGIQLSDNQAADAKRLRWRYEQDMRLLDDLGWDQDPNSDRFDLTLPHSELRVVLERLYWSSAATLSFSCEVDLDGRRDALETQRACSELLANLTEYANPER